MAIKINWGQLDGQFAQQVIERVNREAANLLEQLKDKLPKEGGLSRLRVLSLDWGSTPPEIQVLHIGDGYTREELARLVERERKMCVREETLLHRRQQQQQQQQQQPVKEFAANHDQHSVHSSSTSSSARLGLGASTSKASVLMKLRALQQQSRQQSITQSQQQQQFQLQAQQQQQQSRPQFIMQSNPLMIAAQISHPELLPQSNQQLGQQQLSDVAQPHPRFIKTRYGAYSVASGSQHQNDIGLDAPIDSLRKPLLRTRICSMYNKGSSKKYQRWLNRKSVRNLPLNNLPILQEMEKKIPITLQQQGNEFDNPKQLIQFLCGERGVLFQTQLHYNGNASLSLECQVSVNVPVPNLVTFPIHVKLGHFVVDGL